MVPIVRTEEIVAMVLVASFANVRIIILYSSINSRIKVQVWILGLFWVLDLFLE